MLDCTTEVSSGQGNPCECVIQCQKGQSQLTFKIFSVTVPSSHPGIFPPLYHQTSPADDWNLWRTFPRTSQLQPCKDRLSTWGNCLSAVRGVSSVPAPVDLSPVPSPLTSLGHLSTVPLMCLMFFPLWSPRLGQPMSPLSFSRLFLPSFRVFAFFPQM